MTFACVVSAARFKLLPQKNVKLHRAVISYRPSITLRKDKPCVRRNIHFDGAKRNFQAQNKFCYAIDCGTATELPILLFTSRLIKVTCEKNINLPAERLPPASKLLLPKSQTLVPSISVSRSIKVPSENNITLPAERLPPNASFPWSCRFIRFKWHAWLCLPQWSLSPKKLKAYLFLSKYVSKISTTLYRICSRNKQKGAICPLWVQTAPCFYQSSRTSVFTSE